MTIDGDEIAGRIPVGQARTLLTFMLASPDLMSDRSELIEALWPHQPPKDPQSYLRPVLSRLRSTLAPATIEGRERLRLVLPEPVVIDVEEAGECIELTREAAEENAWERVSLLSGRARDLTSGGFLPGQEGEWVEARRRQVADLELEALEWSAQAGLRLGGIGLREAEPLARELIERSPYREGGYRVLMEILNADGNPAEALLVYEDLRTILRDELGTSPDQEIQELHRALLGGEAQGPKPTEQDRVDRKEPHPTQVPLPPALSPRARGTFVGREAEMETLLKTWDRTREGQREVVLLAGEAGIGKTRLASEFALQAHSDGTVLHAGCPQESLLPYQPICDALRHFALNHDLRELIGKLGAGAAYLTCLDPTLADCPPLPPEASREDPESRRYMMFDAVAALFAEASRRSPVLLVLDDLHWADPQTLQLLRHLLTSPHRASLFVLATSRVGESTAGDSLTELVGELRRTRQFQKVRLTGLDSGEVGRLISFYAGAEAPRELLETVHEGTDGNPFFVEEVLRNLVEDGVLLDREGHWVARLTDEDIGLPEGVEEVLAGRLARLSPGCLASLRRAAVLGREFSHEILAEMADPDSGDLITFLEEALSAHLIVEGTGDGELRYEFTHALIREALYRGLTGARRQQLHADAADAVGRVGGTGSDSQVAALALHYRLAERAGDPDKAIEFSLRAGTRAFELLAWDEAAIHWEGTVAVLERLDRDPELQADLLVSLADLMVVIGDVGRQIDLLERALQLSEVLGDAERTAKVHSRLGIAHSLMDSIYAEFLDIGKSFTHFDAARETLARGPVRAARGHLEIGVATAHTYGIRIGDGIEASGRAMETAEELGNDRVWMGAAEAHGWHLIVSGNLGRGLQTVERALEMAGDHKRPFLAWMAANILGQLTWGLGDPGQAQKHFERAGSLPYIERSAYRQQLADGIGRCQASRGEFETAGKLLSDAKPAWFTHSLKPLVQLWQGDWDGVEQLADEVLKTSQRTGNRWDEWAAGHLAARLLDLRGDPGEAVNRLERSLEIVEGGGAKYFEMWVRPDLARSLVELGRAEEAREQVARGRDILSQGEDWRGRSGGVDLADGLVLALEGRPEEADAAFTRALETFEQYELRCEAAETMYQWGKSLTQTGSAQVATDRLDSAIEMFERHGAGVLMLERAKKARHDLAAAAD